MATLQDTLPLYDFPVPPEQVAQAPASPRDSSRLLVYRRDTGKKDWVTFRDIGQFLPKNAILVLNRTKVIPAKLELTRSTGGKVSVLSLGVQNGVLKVMANKGLKIGEELRLSSGGRLPAEGHPSTRLRVINQDEKYWLLKPLEISTDDLFEQHGTMPLPPYIDKSPLTRNELKERYQSVFAEHPGSIAAPTASLHFTPELLQQLKAQGIQYADVILHVHLGTFAPLDEEKWNSGRLHQESYEVPQATIDLLKQAKQEGRPIIPVGTTAVRTLETVFDASGNCTQPSGITDLFIREGYHFKMIDGMITNFHVPKSSLLMLVAAFVGRGKLMSLYAEAIERNMRLFSFGDAMLLI